MGSKTTSKFVSKIVRNPTLLKTCFLQPLTHIMKVFSVLKASNFDQTLIKKVMSKRIPPKCDHFKVPGASQRVHGAEKAPKRLPWEGVHELTFSTFFEFWAVLGPKCLQELSQEPPELPQASIFDAFWHHFWITLASFFYTFSASIFASNFGWPFSRLFVPFGFLLCIFYAKWIKNGSKMISIWLHNGSKTTPK